MNGLASQGMQQGQEKDGNEEIIEQIIKLLQQGVTPEELIKKGVPKELIMQAIQMLQQSSAQQSGASQMPNQMQGSGLAQSGMQ